MNENHAKSADRRCTMRTKRIKFYRNPYFDLGRIEFHQNFGSFRIWQLITSGRWSNSIRTCLHYRIKQISSCVNLILFVGGGQQCSLHDRNRWSINNVRAPFFQLFSCPEQLISHKINPFSIKIFFFSSGPANTHAHTHFTLAGQHVILNLRSTMTMQSHRQHRHLNQRKRKEKAKVLCRCCY